MIRGMTSSKRLLAIAFVLLALAGLIVGSLMIVTTDSSAERTCKLIQVGMTEGQVSTTLEGAICIAIAHDSTTSFYGYDWNDGSSMYVQYGSDGRVIKLPTPQRSKETPWKKMQRLIRERIWRRW
jgi:hypothetical protein